MNIKKRPMIAVLGIFALAGAGTAVGIASASAAPEASTKSESRALEATSETKQLSLADYGIESASRAASVGDQIAADIRLSELGFGGIDPASTRLLGESADSLFYSAQDAEGKICLVITFKAEKELASASCGSAESFAANGISSQVGSQQHSSEAYLVPDAAIGKLPAVASLSGSNSANLIIGDPTVNGEATSARATDGQFPLFVFEEPLDLTK